jgi:pimeloyl-ACP methyl ester carboxylesterase
MKCISDDGTTIAFDRQGDGPPVILIDGAIAYKEIGPMRALAAELSQRFTVYRYDRRGRGESGDAPAYAVEREIEDVNALIEHAGSAVSLLGLSSGGVLALDAAAHGLAVESVIVYEAPVIVDDSRAPLPHDYRERLAGLLADGARGDAVKLFMRQVGVPGFLVALMPLFPAWGKLKAVAPTLVYDTEIMAGTQVGKPLPDDRWTAVRVPTLVANGSKSPPWLHRAADALAAVLPNAIRRTITGANHGAKASVVGPELAAFLASTGSRMEIGCERRCVN